MVRVAVRQEELVGRHHPALALQTVEPEGDVGIYTDAGVLLVELLLELVVVLVLVLVVVLVLALVVVLLLVLMFLVACVEDCVYDHD